MPKSSPFLTVINLDFGLGLTFKFCHLSFMSSLIQALGYFDTSLLAVIAMRSLPLSEKNLYWNKM